VIVNIDENDKPVVDEIARFVPQVIVTHPNAPEDNLSLYRLLGGIFGREMAEEQLSDALRAALGAALRETTALPRENVLYLIWQDPWMTVARDTYISRTLAAVGWDTVPAAANARYPTVDLIDAARDATLVMLSSEPYRFRAAHVAAVQQRLDAHAQAHADVRLRHQQVMLIDGEMTSWYGSRAIHGLAYLARQRVARAGGHGSTG
jgi:ABC-type Fe3+-hydroxamate transport system substrate-binding protein